VAAVTASASRDLPLQAAVPSRRMAAAPTSSDDSDYGPDSPVVDDGRRQGQQVCMISEMDNSFVSPSSITYIELYNVLLFSTHDCICLNPRRRYSPSLLQQAGAVSQPLGRQAGPWPSGGEAPLDERGAAANGAPCPPPPRPSSSDDDDDFRDSLIKSGLVRWQPDKREAWRHQRAAASASKWGIRLGNSTPAAPLVHAMPAVPALGRTTGGSSHAGAASVTQVRRSRICVSQ